MTRPTLDSSAPARRRFGGWVRSCATGGRLVACAVLGLALAACGGGSGGGSDGGAGTPDGGGTPVATEPVDLPPGQTEALIAWEPSQGLVTGYMVFVSRNGRFFQFDSVVDEPRTFVQGVPGDVVRILVAAVGVDDQTSSTSPPSVPIRFHTDPTASSGDEGGASLPPVGGGVPDPTPDPTPDPAPDPTPDPTPDPAPDAGAGDPTPTDPTPTGDPDPTTDPSPDSTPDAPADTTVLTSTLRTRLLTSDLKGTLAGLSAAARAWIAPWLSGEVPTDLDPIATAEGETEGWRDVVWQDASGQLFVSEGAALAASDGPASNLVPTIQLVASEHFVALADLDGDGVRDWIVADDESGTATFRSDANAEPRAARAADQADTTRLVGSGDFDGDGRLELLWQSEDGALERARPDGRLPALATGVLPPAGYRIVAVADLEGDGRDDLIARAGDGLLAVGLAEVTSAGLGLAWTVGLAEAGVDSELVATLDLDDDGRAELVWLTDGAAEIRGLGETAPRAF